MSSKPIIVPQIIRKEHGCQYFPNSYRGTVLFVLLNILRYIFFILLQYFLNLRFRINIYYKIIRIPINIIRVVRIKKETSRPEVFKTCVINLKTRALDVFNARVKSKISRSWFHNTLFAKQRSSNTRDRIEYHKEHAPLVQ